MLDNHELATAKTIAQKAAMWNYNGLSAKDLQRDIDIYIGNASKYNEILAEARKMYRSVKIQNNGKWVAMSGGEFIFVDSLENAPVNFNWVRRQLERQE